METVPLFAVDAPAPAVEDEAPKAPAFEVVVRGLPGPQGSKRHVGGGRMIESSAKVKPWRESVVWMAVAARQKIKGFTKLDGPLAADMVFCFDRPKGHMGTGRNAGLVRPSAPMRPDVTPDLSKLVRATEDALTTSGVYRDDALIVEYRQLGKFYTTDHGLVPGVLDGPGCTIRLWRIEQPKAVEA
ncbi:MULTISPECIES: RusA family crossover junction endodeoxyribonuclease [unclassified Streptomyces]|uniref:RusA family crossover junction endodeoxyribonuclease n=1 Tax=unclassified Streptomyces TaxID=2593676 RepID=UPI00109E4A2E|nr:MULTISPECIES: RusA family crossover junction endodeoxyribonuclease [unclassified Streptomyces]MBT2453325.1 RusA family crossover junction endodeoxyribonuclease [Streptomyces sp. ISL-86]THA50823.1 RusA family crossover junction endodeoxyribonuclease [Streptomyces sp. A1136]